MGFRDDFINGYWLTPVGPRQRTFAQWSLENTVESGLRANQKQVALLREQLSSAFRAGIDRLADGQLQSAKLLQREIQYQTDNLINAIDRGSTDVVDALQRTCDYLGGQLCEVRWAIDRQTQVSGRILQVLLSSLDNSSRQYWEQGVKCYETSEHLMAKERFNRALDANRTNYFAYQYLGFIAVHDENSQEAINNFDLARKFADSGHSRALALSHLARSYQAAGDLRKAIQSSTAATEAAPERARFWYETAVYRVRASNAEEAILNLRQAISTDWTYWSVSISDANLDPLRNRVERLLADMREEQRVLARQRLDHFVGTLKILREMQIMADIAGWEKRLEQFESSYRTGTVFAFRDLVEPARDVERQALEAAVVALDQRINTLHKALTKAQADCSRELSQAFSRVQEIENRASSVEKSYSSSGFAGCLAVIGGIVAAWCFVGFNAVPAFDSADRHNYAVGGMVAFVILIIGLGWKPMMKLLNADLPARNIRSEIPGAKQAYERIKADSESRLGVEKAGIDRELGPLTQYKEQCRARSTSV